MQKYYHLYYATHTILNWIPLLKRKEFQQVILDTFQFLVDEKRIIIYAFVIMPNHIHYLYEVLDPFEDNEIKHSFLSFTSKKIMARLTEKELADFYVNKNDRMKQIWKSPSLSVAIFTDKFLDQKLNYIHNNPVAANLVSSGEKYELSSCNSYLNNNEEFKFLTLW